MSNVIVGKSEIAGVLAAMPSKSFAHRILICSALSDGPVEVRGIVNSKDMLATLRCITALGGEAVPMGEGGYLINPVKHTKNAVFDCGESGSTLRFMLAVASAIGGNHVFTGCGRLAERPNGELLNALAVAGIKATGNGLPLEINGKLTPGEYVVDGGVSSQFVSGLLLAAPLVGGEVTVTVKGQLKSRGYVDITIDVMKRFGVTVRRQGASFIVDGGQKYLSPKKIEVEGDWSNAAFPLAMGLLCGKVEVHGLNENSLQGDKAVVDVMRRLGGSVVFQKGAYIAQKSHLKGANFSVENIIDAAPVLSVLCAFAKGESRISGVNRLRLKESDRLEAIISLVKSIGGRAYVDDGELVISGGECNGRCTVDGVNDHRIVMSGVVAGAYLGNVVVTDAGAVRKSYPSFFEQFKDIGGAIDDI